MPNTRTPKKLPVTVLSGFLGSGKTTLLQHILKSKDHGLRCAVIVNDMAEINIDGSNIENNQLIQREEKLIQMQNGCICCTLREDLLEEVNRLASEGRFDYLLIESTGVSEPMQVAETFTTEFSQSLEQGSGDPSGKDFQKMMRSLESLSKNARLDTCVSMVDASTFFHYFNSPKFLAEAFDDAGDEESKTVVDLLVSQIEFADVILLNKLDSVTDKEAIKIEGILKSFNTTAKVIRTTYSKVDVKEILDTGLFDMQKAVTSSGWLKSLHEKPMPETIEYGISSFVYRQRRPFHPLRIFKLIKTAYLVIENPGIPELNGIEELLAALMSNIKQEDELVEEKAFSRDKESSESESEDVESGSDENSESESEEDVESGSDENSESESESDDEDDSDESETSGSELDDEKNDSSGLDGEVSYSKSGDDEEKLGFKAEAREAVFKTKDQSAFKNVLRSKGTLWISGKDKFMADWSQAGIILSITNEGKWFVDRSAEELEGFDEAFKEKISQHFGNDNPMGDKRQEIVFIGNFADDGEKERLKEELDNCLMRDDEIVDFGEDGDPWGQWY